MQMTLRWYGSKHDTVTLEQIRQIPGVKSVITTLYDSVPGEAWSVEDIRAMKQEVEAAGLTIAGIESYANSKGYNLILGLSDSNRKKESFYLEMLQRERVDGLLVLPTFMDLVIEKLNPQNPAQAPVVLCGSSGNRSNISMSYAKCNNHIGARLATNHLIETGRKRIGCIFPVFNEQQIDQFNKYSFLITDVRSNCFERIRKESAA